MRIVSGIQPSGELHIGNYLGAIKHFAGLQEQNECLFFLADLHALTENPEADDIRENTKQAAIDYLALGIDPQRAILFVQSAIPAHSELMWLLATLTPIGELERMTQYKDKSKAVGKKDLINAGLLSYPILMAADILLYRPDAVPVGDDQKQHMELTRNIAQRFNSRFGDFFTVPESLIPEIGSRIMSIQDPKKKMSKSHGVESVIGIFDEPPVIEKKIKRAVTDSAKKISYDPKKRPAIANLLDIYALMNDISPKSAAKEFEGKGYGDFKKALSALLIEKLAPFRERRAMLEQSPAHVSAVLEQGQKRASSIAGDTLREVQRRMGIR